MAGHFGSDVLQSGVNELVKAASITRWLVPIPEVKIDRTIDLSAHEVNGCHRGQGRTESRQGRKVTIRDGVR